jgi:hypothetical protein
MQGQDFKLNTAVKDYYGNFGFVAKVVYDLLNPSYSTVFFVDFNTGELVLEVSGALVQCGGCECGNPFSLCHGEA